MKIAVTKIINHFTKKMRQRPTIVQNFTRNLESRIVQSQDQDKTQTLLNQQGNKDIKMPKSYGQKDPCLRLHGVSEPIYNLQ